MKMNPLGRTGLTVSELCLGTMTFGTQTSEAEGHAQNGINGDEPGDVDHGSGNEDQYAPNEGLHNVPERAPKIEVALLTAVE